MARLCKWSARAHHVPVPDGAKGGERVSTRLGPPPAYTLEVPEGLSGGDTFDFDGNDGEKLEATVPMDKVPGDSFDVMPPTVMVQVPRFAKPGDQVAFQPDGHEEKLVARVPQGLTKGQYFAVILSLSEEAPRDPVQDTQGSGAQFSSL